MERKMERSAFATTRQTLQVPEVQTVSLKLWRSDAVVLFDWLTKTNLDTVPIEHPAEKQALADLLTRLEADTDVAYGLNGDGLTQAEIDAARTAVSKDMGW
jgi:hypothetical protein